VCVPTSPTRARAPRAESPSPQALPRSRACALAGWIYGPYELGGDQYLRLVRADRAGVVNETQPTELVQPPQLPAARQAKPAVILAPPRHRFNVPLTRVTRYPRVRGKGCVCAYKPSRAQGPRACFPSPPADRADAGEPVTYRETWLGAGARRTGPRANAVPP
jgi:hypothetical protein